VAAQGGRKKFRFKNKLMSLDGSVIDLSVSLFDWAKFRRTKGRSNYTCCWTTTATCFVRGGDRRKHSELKVARTLHFERERFWPSIGATSTTTGSRS